MRACLPNFKLTSSNGDIEGVRIYVEIDDMAAHSQVVEAILPTSGNRVHVPRGSCGRYVASQWNMHVALKLEEICRSPGQYTLLMCYVRSISYAP